jgi:hypothetical protein
VGGTTGKNHSPFSSVPVTPLLVFISPGTFCEPSDLPLVAACIANSLLVLFYVKVIEHMVRAGDRSWFCAAGDSFWIADCGASKMAVAK